MRSAELCEYWPTPARPVIAKMCRLDNSVSSSRSDNRRPPSKGRRVLHKTPYPVRALNPTSTNKYLQATTKSKRLAQGKLVDAILPGGVLSGSKSNLIH
jgi:hypothetical protein